MLGESELTASTAISGEGFGDAFKSRMNDGVRRARDNQPRIRYGIGVGGHPESHASHPPNSLRNSIDRLGKTVGGLRFY